MSRQVYNQFTKFITAIDAQKMLKLILSRRKDSKGMAVIHSKNL